MSPSNPVPGQPQRPRWNGPSLVSALPILAPGMRKQATSLLCLGGVFLISAILLFSLHDPFFVQAIVALQISILLLALISMLCGKHKPLLSYIVSAVLAAFVMLLLLPFFQLVTFDDRQDLGSFSLGWPFIHLVFGVGVREEIVKAVPIFVMAGLARLQWGARWRAIFSIDGPIDGILMGAASGTGFTLVETVGIYAPHHMLMLSKEGADIGMQGYFGLTLVLARVLTDVGSHVAWSGFFGYTIGLAQTYPPQRRLMTLGIGLAIVALLHALWDDFSAPPTFFIIGMVSYALLVSAILAARQRAGTLSAPKPVSASALSLHVGALRIPLVPGTTLTNGDLRDLHPTGPGPVVASVQANPAAPGVLGLRNESRETWLVRPLHQPPAGLHPGRTIRLSPGLSIRFGGTNGLVG